MALFYLVLFLMYLFKSDLITFPPHHAFSKRQSLPVFNNLNLFSEDAQTKRSQDLLSACRERDLLFIFPTVSVKVVPVCLG